MKVFFISETNRADSQTWIRGLKEFGNFEVETWEIKPRSGPFSRIYRMWDWLMACLFLGKRIRKSVADILLAERLTSYGFIGACTGFHPFVIAQQGITDIWPMDSATAPLRIFLAKTALKKADIIQAWGDAMVPSMLKMGAAPEKIRILAKGVDLNRFNYEIGDKKWDQIEAVVTRSLTPDYNHETIIRAAKLLKDNNIPIAIKIIGDGNQMKNIQTLSRELEVEDIVSFTGRVPNDELSAYLTHANMYISVPVTEGVSSSLFEAMGAGLFPIVTDLPGTRAWIGNGDNGFLVPVGNPEVLATAMIEAWNDKPLMQKAIAFNRNLVETKADYNKNMPLFIEWYKELVNGKARTYDRQ